VEEGRCAALLLPTEEKQRRKEGDGHAGAGAGQPCGGRWASGIFPYTTLAYDQLLFDELPI
jgi:hypothetical protein